MDIGGTDTTLKSSYPSNVAALVVLGYFYMKYPSGRFENDDLDNLDGRKEFFFYTSEEAQDRWNTHGWTENFGKEMFHVITEKGESSKSDVTIVHEDRDDLDFPEIESLLNQKF